MVDGTTVAGYRVERKLGSGGMAVVYLAQHPRLPRRDAVKVLNEIHSDNAEFQARFLREAELAARLEHPNLVAVRDCGIDNGRPWIAMQYIDGIDVEQLIRRGPAAITPQRAVFILGEVARGLDEIHHAGLVHRDVKPANIMITNDGERVLVTDFGIARAVDETSALTGTGSVLATLNFAAPEQLYGGALDPRVDVYALGCTLFQMLTGSVPYPRTTHAAVMHAQLYEPPPRPTQLMPSLPAELDTVIATAMAKDPAQRYPTCGALAAAATAAMYPVPTPLAPTLTRHPTGSDRPRNRARIGIITTAVVLGVIGALTAAALALRPDESATATSTTAGPSSTAAINAVKDFRSWGQYSYIGAALPGILTERPSILTFGETAACNPVDQNENVLPVDTKTTVHRVQCLGDANPVDTLTIRCNPDRTPRIPDVPEGVVSAGEERWTRNSGSGRLLLGSIPRDTGGTRGVLYVFFDDPDRSFCSVEARGGSTGAELLARWWPSAPV